MAISVAIIAASALGFPNVTGYGTVLYQVVVFSAFGLLAHMTSFAYADTHHYVAWPIASAASVIVFLIPESGPWLFVRRRSPMFFALITFTWCAFYVACLFWFFPATDGP